LTITPGTRIGVYDVTAAIGEGGMGQVYRARDTKLDRDVAIKILPEAFADDSDRVARFQREARTLAALNHPNIAGIYGLEESAGVTALVMELVDGEDLSDKIRSGAGHRASGTGMPLDEALPIAKQIADALEAAHEQGIVHRDLKPANIKVRADGTVKVLDFGLAKAMETGGGNRGSGSGGTLANSPTMTSPAMTMQGVILGTAAYMSPEQAKGRAVDRRADIWAFGVVLHEMLTGARLFEAEDISETLAAVLTREISLTALPATTPPRLRALLRDCLVRDPRQRLRDIGEARRVLDAIIAGASDDAVAMSTAPAARSGSAAGRVLPWVIAAASTLVAGAVLLWVPWRAQAPADRPLMRLEVDLGDSVSLPSPTSSGASIAISPDGRWLAYTSGTPAMLFVRRLDQPTATELAGTQGATQPFFSPDGKSVGFVTGRGLARISVDGGLVTPLGDFTSVRGAAWTDDGSIFVAGDQKLLRIHADGGTPQTIAEPRDGELGLLGPEPLPGSRALLVGADNPGPVDKSTIDLITLADGQRKTLVQGGASPRYLATADGAGHLVYLQGATLFAIPFDVTTLSTLGTAVQVAEDVAHDRLTGAGQFAVSRTGTFVYRKAVGDASALMTLHWLDTSGSRQPLGAAAGLYRDMKVSPDGSRVALTLADGTGQDVLVYDTRRDTTTRLTFGGVVYRFPRWSADGRHIVVSAAGKGMLQIRADGGSRPEPLTPSTSLRFPAAISPDGKWLAYSEEARLSIVGLEQRDGVLRAGAPAPFESEATVAQRAASFSPDGRWLAFESEQSGTREVYVRRFPSPSSGNGGQWLVSTGGGIAPRWSRNGRDLLYQSGDQIMAVRYTTSGDAFVAEKPRVWIARLGGPDALWDVTPDATRIAVVSQAAGAESVEEEHTIVFVQNFFDELVRRVAIGK